jgi:hypothetical protein
VRAVLKTNVSGEERSVVAPAKPAGPRRLAVAGGQAARPSPVGDLQLRLLHEYAVEDDIQPWPIHVRLPFIVLSSAALWWGIIAGARALLHL